MAAPETDEAKDLEKAESKLKDFIKEHNLGETKNLCDFPSVEIAAQFQAMVDDYNKTLEAFLQRVSA